MCEICTYNATRLPWFKCSNCGLMHPADTVQCGDIKVGSGNFIRTTGGLEAALEKEIKDEKEKSP